MQILPMLLPSPTFSESSALNASDNSEQKKNHVILDSRVPNFYVS